MFALFSLLPPVEVILPEQIAPSQTEESANHKSNTGIVLSSPGKETFPAPAITESGADLTLEVTGEKHTTRCGRLVKPLSYLNDYVC